MDLPAWAVPVVPQRGGRPPKLARDVAVMLFHHLRVNHNGGGSNKAAAEAVGLFDLSDPGDVRRCIRNARKCFRDSVIFVIGDAALIFPASGVYPRIGSIGWGWAENMPEAIQLRVRSTATSFPSFRLT